MARASAVAVRTADTGRRLSRRTMPATPTTCASVRSISILRATTIVATGSRSVLCWLNRIQPHPLADKLLPISIPDTPSRAVPGIFSSSPLHKTDSIAPRILDARQKMRSCHHFFARNHRPLREKNVILQRSLRILFVWIENFIGLD